MAVLSRLVVKGGNTGEMQVVGQITSCWVGEDKQGRYNMEENWQAAQSNPRTRPGWTHSLGASRVSRSSMYMMYMDILLQSI